MKIISEFKRDDIVFNHYIYEENNREVFLPHTHDALEIVYLKNGDITYTIEDKNYRVGSGALILTREGLVHNILFNSKEIYDRYCIVFDKGILKSEVYNKIPKTLNVIDASQNDNIVDIFRKADYYFNHLSNEDYHQILKSLTEEVLCNVMLQSDEIKQFTAHPYVTSAIALIKSDLSYNIAEICDLLHITKSYLHKLFIKHLGVTPKEYIISKRLEKARLEIQEGMAPTDVYINCGFTDYCTFYRNYKKYFGYIPSREPERKITQMIKT